MSHVIHLRLGDSFEVIPTIEAIGAVVTDPPYLIDFMGKAWDSVADGDMQVWHLRWLTLCFDKLPVGGIIKVFSATRTFHRLAAAMAEAGFSGLDLEAWAYGSGFPKYLNVSKAIDIHMGKADDRPVIGTSRGVSVDDDQGFGGIARGAVGVVQKAIDLPVTEAATPEAAEFEGWATALKPSWEPFIVGVKEAA